MASLPPPDLDKYLWTSVPSDPLRFERYASGGEVFVDLERRHAQGQYSMFLGTKLSLSSKVESQQFLHLARQAWKTLRHSVPTVAAWTEPNVKGDTLIVYHVASGKEEAQSWAERTVQLVTTGTADDARNHLLDNLVPEDSHDQTSLHIISDSRPSNDYTLILSTIHTLFDSTGHKTLMHRFLSILARYIEDAGLAGKETAALEWGSEGANLLPSYTDILADSEPVRGPGYDQTLGGILQDMATTTPRMHQYVRRPGKGGPVMSRRIEHKFTEEQTAQIKRHCKSKGLTVNQLVHAAIFLSSLLDNPVVADDGLFTAPAAINTRDRLRAPFNAARAYPGLCVSLSPITVPVSVARGLEGKAQLDAVAAVVKQEYARQKAYPALLGALAQMTDLIIESMKTNPPLQLTGPNYVGDGIIERELDRTYTDHAGAESISVAEFWYSVRQTNPGQNFRVYSWRDRLVIGVDFNESLTPREAVEDYLRDTVQFLTM